nr:MAG TPA: hypothetical protein [Caudoviricetes sp.]
MLIFPTRLIGTYFILSLELEKVLNPHDSGLFFGYILIATILHHGIERFYLEPSNFGFLVFNGLFQAHLCCAETLIQAIDSLLEVIFAFVFGGEKFEKILGFHNNFPFLNVKGGRVQSRTRPRLWLEQSTESRQVSNTQALPGRVSGLLPVSHRNPFRTPITSVSQAWQFRHISYRGNNIRPILEINFDRTTDNLRCRGAINPGRAGDQNFEILGEDGCHGVGVALRLLLAHYVSPFLER